jgi:hypothetical protein
MGIMMKTTTLIWKDAVYQKYASEYIDIFKTYIKSRNNIKYDTVIIIIEISFPVPFIKRIPNVTTIKIKRGEIL